MSEKNLFHEPVLKKEILALLFSNEIRTVFDGTVGLGGHGEALLEQFSSITKYIACDLDKEHLVFAEKRLSAWGKKMIFCHSNFSAIKKLVQKNDIERPLAILLDLGLCSHHVDNADKGFSFEKEGPLAMAFDSTSGKDCAQILNSESEQELARILHEYGEEPLARKLARKIVEARETKPFETTFDLRQLIEENTIPQTRKKTMMRVFQGLRIAVNDELNVLQQTLEDALAVMESGDRMGVISYHSLEDRIVKKFTVSNAKPETMATDLSLHTEIAPAKIRLLSRKPIVPTPEEIEINPRSRSAKLRLFEKTI
jgi:16S rRNA (cytosine1402-N4)-methyltransferase